MRLAPWLAALSVVLGSISGCGSRTELSEVSAGSSLIVPCESDTECNSGQLCHPGECFEGFCRLAEPIECDDSDVCTEDECNPSTGECEYRPLTVDLDGDGFRGPRPGFAPGVPEACGDDCDDTSPLAYPGGVEYCDGLDNDCNGVRDDGAVYQRVNAEAVRISKPEDTLVGHSGLAFDGTSYGLTMHVDRDLRFLRLSTSGEVELERSIIDINGGTFGGPLAYTGQFYGAAWSDDRRGGEYDVYFNLLDRNGATFGPDLRITETDDFSRSVRVVYHSGEFLLFWDDYRVEDEEGWVGVYAQRVNLDGEAVGGNQLLTPRGLYAEGVSVAVGDERIGIAYLNPVSDVEVSMQLMSVPFDFSGPSSIIEVAAGFVSRPSVRYLGDRFLVVWYEDYPEGVGDVIWGRLFDEAGNPLSPATPLVEGGGYARSANARPLGDRFLLFWADKLDGDYELYVKMLSNDLVEMSPRERLTFAAGDSLSPLVEFGPSGELGVVFSDDRDGTDGVYFLRMACSAGAF
jgi:hypothetical protein